VDHGRFVHVARRLGQEYAKVYYFTPTERDCPLMRESVVGQGFEEIERVTSIWEVKDKIDVAIFPDLCFAFEQEELRSQGVPVWGCGDAGRLEYDKQFFLDTLAETDLPVPEYQVIHGLTNLRLFLKKTEDVYIKISTFRGDWETMHWTCWTDMEGELDHYAVRFGPLKDTLNFYVFEPIDTEVEDGVDAYRVNGQWPEMVLHGMEAKDKAFIGTMCRREDVPEDTWCANEAFGSILDQLTRQGAMKFSTEVRITEDHDSYLIDPTCRFGSPPSQGECLLYQNLGEIIYRGALGELVEPETEHDFVVQAWLSVDGDRDEWKSIEIPDELDDHIKGGFCCRQDGKLCLTPIAEYHSSEVGYLCATGATMKEAIEALRELKDKLPCGLKCEFNSLADILKEIHEAEASGMKFTDTIVPEPEEIIADG
jgi:hypothetical protein